MINKNAIPLLNPCHVMIMQHTNSFPTLYGTHTPVQLIL